MVNDPCQLYQESDDAEIDVIWMPLRVDQSMAVQIEDGSCIIGMDPWKLKTVADEVTSLGHELGHCKTGSFYDPSAKFDLKKKHENRADRWAIKRLVPLNDFDTAIATGHVELWDLADYFNVTEDFMKKAVCLYTYGNLAADLYF